MSRRGQPVENRPEWLRNSNETLVYGRHAENWRSEFGFGEAHWPHNQEYRTSRASSLREEREYSHDLIVDQTNCHRVDERCSENHLQPLMNQFYSSNALNLFNSRKPPHSYEETHLHRSCNRPTAGFTDVDVNASRQSVDYLRSSMPFTGSTMVEMRSSRRSVASFQSCSSHEMEMAWLSEELLERFRERNRKIDWLREKVKASEDMDAWIANEANRDHHHSQSGSEKVRIKWLDKALEREQQRNSTKGESANEKISLSNAGIRLGAKAERYLIGQAIPTAPFEPQTRPRTEVAIEPIERMPQDQATAAMERNAGQQIPWNNEPPKPVASGYSLDTGITSHRESESKSSEGAIRVAENVSNFSVLNMNESAGKAAAEIQHRITCFRNWTNTDEQMCRPAEIWAEEEPMTGTFEQTKAEELPANRTTISSLDHEEARNLKNNGKRKKSSFRWKEDKFRSEKKARLATLQSSTGRNTPESCVKSSRATEKSHTSHTVNPDTLICCSSSLFSVDLPPVQNSRAQMSICSDYFRDETSVRELRRQNLEPVEKRAQLNLEGCGSSPDGNGGASRMENQEPRQEGCVNESPRIAEENRTRNSLKERVTENESKIPKKASRRTRKRWKDDLYWKRYRPQTLNKKKCRTAFDTKARDVGLRRDVRLKSGGLLSNQLLCLLGKFRNRLTSKFRRKLPDAVTQANENRRGDEMAHNNSEKAERGGACKLPREGLANDPRKWKSYRRLSRNPDSAAIMKASGSKLEEFRRPRLRRRKASAENAKKTAATAKSSQKRLAELPSDKYSNANRILRKLVVDKRDGGGPAKGRFTCNLGNHTNRTKTQTARAKLKTGQKCADVSLWKSCTAESQLIENERLRKMFLLPSIHVVKQNRLSDVMEPATKHKTSRINTQRLRKWVYIWKSTHEGG